MVQKFPDKLQAADIRVKGDQIYRIVRSHEDAGHRAYVNAITDNQTRQYFSLTEPQRVFNGYRLKAVCFNINLNILRDIFQLNGWLIF